jgi:hypothetical protein
MQQMNSGTENNEITSRKKWRRELREKPTQISSETRQSRNCREKSTTAPVAEEITKLTNVRLLTKNVANVGC